MGFVSQVVKGGAEEVVAAALDFAAQVLLCSPDAIQASMQVVKKSMAEHHTGDIVGSMRAQKSYPAGVRMNKGPNRIEVRSICVCVSEQFLCSSPVCAVGGVHATCVISHPCTRACFNYSIYINHSIYMIYLFIRLLIY